MAALKLNVKGARSTAASSATTATAASVIASATATAVFVMAIVIVMLSLSAVQTASAFSFLPLQLHGTRSARGACCGPRHPIMSSTIHAVDEQTWFDLYDFNVALDRMAERSGNFDQDVIYTASECQSVFESQVQEAAAAAAADDDASADGETSMIVEPDTISLNTVLKAWSRCASVLSEGSEKMRNRAPDARSTLIPIYTARDAAERATSLLFQHEQDQSIKVDTTSYNIVIDAWAKSRVDDAPEAAERLLRRMESRDVEPDTFTYHGVIDAWGYSGKEESTSKVRQIFSYMQNLHESGKNIKPTARTVNSVIHTHARMASYYASLRNNLGREKALQCAHEAQEVFDNAIKRYKETGDPDIQPDVTMYTTMIDAYSRCATYEATERAEILLEDLVKEYKKTENPRLRPNYRTYTSLIGGWSRTKSQESPDKVEKLLKEMEKTPATRPNSRTYTVVIQCWAKARDPSKAKRALRLLRDLKEKYKESGDDELKPSILTYNAVIDACARCQGRMEDQTEALKIAFAVMKAAEQDPNVEINQVTLYTLLNAAAYLLPPGAERNKIAMAVFDKARKRGLVETFTVMNLRRAVDADLFRKTMGMSGQQDKHDHDIKIENLPASWSKNVRRS